MRQMIFAATLAGALLLGNFANAQPRGKQDNRKKSQQERIQDGVRNGSITHNEAMRLQMQQAKLRGYRQMAKADGRVNRKERGLMRNEMQRANRNIYHAKHNGQFRKGGGYAQKGGQGFNGREGFRGGHGDFHRRGGQMAFKGQGFRGNDGGQFRKGDGGNNFKSQGYRGRDGFRGDYRKGGQDNKKGGTERLKDDKAEGKTTWQLNNDSRKGSWELK
ncbi:hypothetical protein [Polluticoccus soli]|uniref:hypothetical protein n=1 Tax=Polluticoccus soli TaxID=3034150 RepID=UPI0023E33526|nr:hypothetical protein [Flavipsychrobacter sp. JY13-12]